MFNIYILYWDKPHLIKIGYLQELVKKTKRKLLLKNRFECVLKSLTFNDARILNGMTLKEEAMVLSSIVKVNVYHKICGNQIP